MNKNKGFTLVELMISIALGLLVVAAATQLFITGMVSVNLQKAMAEIQDNSNFGINFVASDLRKVNYNADQPQITSATKFGGILLSSNNFPGDLTEQPATTFFTQSRSESSTTQLTDTQSDQLTIQYYADAITFDCEGNTVSAGNVIVQRYFIDEGHLKCDAAQYPRSAPVKDPVTNITPAYAITGMNANAQIILKNVEYMRILLSTSEDKLQADNVSNDPIPANSIVQKNFKYIEASNYPTAGTLPRVRGIQIGLLVRANDSVSPSAALTAKNAASFRVLDKDVTLKTADSKFLRQVVTQTVALRNAMGASS